jgi:hypothetical protein
VAWNIQAQLQALAFQALHILLPIPLFVVMARSAHLHILVGMQTLQLRSQQHIHRSVLLVAMRVAMLNAMQHLSGFALLTHGKRHREPPMKVEREEK